ncbi:UDP-glucose 4-epimerase GalE [Methylomonas sp. LL1]|uniref:UDP-glucose 4-epimerase GalE n=1 Tax=Methylomonas sp. LL1 TaxID=2785785 RepID=UPI0018C3560B|nr:UDP-glucose 4-epimerase GalE [Methylomonas sp. LL1]QPK64894.1 UDP-glucose 4-epimerase GalE [Methylomonas sp. LL1]
MKNTILVTGGAGYIGSHTCVELLNNGFEVIIVDNLSNSKIESVRRIEQITGQSVKFYQADINDQAALTRIFQNHNVDAVIHFAGLKAVGESCQKPLNYYQNNISGTLVLLEAMAEQGVKSLVFSSSATVYGDPHTVPITESFPLQATNPYGRTKLFIEEILRDANAADALNRDQHPWKIAILRYFNPIGAHHSGLIGEDPNGIPNNLMPYLSQVAIGKLPILSVFGNDYPTHDGTGVRDYIHVVDLARGHIKALQYLMKQSNDAPICDAFNLGTGNGYSVLDMINTFSHVTGQPVPYQITPRRSGDVAACYADPTLALEKLDWKAEKDLQQMMVDVWRWQNNNPDGYN